MSCKSSDGLVPKVQLESLRKECIDVDDNAPL